MNDEVRATPRSQLITAAGAVLDDCEWSLDGGDTEYRLVTPDRTLVVERRPGPDADPRWAIAVRADGETITKSGPFTDEELSAEVRALLDAEVTYTVCCDG